MKIQKFTLKKKDVFDFFLAIAVLFAVSITSYQNGKKYELNRILKIMDDFKKELENEIH